jgi:hypothetical protein
MSNKEHDSLKGKGKDSPSKSEDDFGKSEKGQYLDSQDSSSCMLVGQLVMA